MVEVSTKELPIRVAIFIGQKKQYNFLSYILDIRTRDLCVFQHHRWLQYAIIVDYNMLKLILLSLYIISSSIDSNKLRRCLVKKNTKCKMPTILEWWNAKTISHANYFSWPSTHMQSSSFSCLVPFKIQNLLPLWWSFEALLNFFCFLRPKSKMENNHLFIKFLHGV